MTLLVLCIVNPLFQFVIGCSSSHAKYYGKLIQNGWGNAATHNLAGDIYAVDSDTFQVIGLVFDSSATPACSGE